MKTIKEYLNREFSTAERAVIGELVKMAELMTNENGEPISEMHRVLGGVFLERAASIIRREGKLHIFNDEYIREFSEFWEINERAKFNEVTTNE